MGHSLCCCSFRYCTSCCCSPSLRCSYNLCCHSCFWSSSDLWTHYCIRSCLHTSCCHLQCRCPSCCRLLRYTAQSGEQPRSCCLIPRILKVVEHESVDDFICVHNTGQLQSC